VTASGKEEINNYNSIPPVCTADETALKSMVRANPGYMLLKNGVIEKKWSWANVPQKDWFARLSEK
jgi:triosephosphate isomerase